MLVLAGLVLLGCRRAPDTLPPDDARVPDGETAREPASETPPVPAASGETPGDRDGDSIQDADDRCPGDPENHNGYQDRDGCPDEIPAQVERFHGTLRGIVFDPGSDAISKRRRDVLDDAAKVLREYPHLRVEIRGHTVAGEPPELSLTRAETVRTYLIERGVAPDQLLVSGAADEEPSDLSGTPAAQAKNRRVEFKPQID